MRGRWGYSFFHIGLERQYMVCYFRLKAEIYLSLKWRGEIHWSLKQRERFAGRSSEGKRSAGHSGKPVSSPALWMFSGRCTTSQKESPPQKKIFANSLWLYSYYPQSSPSKNKNINYIFKYLRVLRCLSSSWIYDIFLCY